jgi:flagellin-like protein
LTRIRNVRNTTKFKRSIKAISPVIATLLMIAIAVVASLVVYAWVTGYMGTTTSNAGKAIQIQSFASDPNSGNLVVYVQNVGQGDVQLNRDQSVYVNSNLIPLSSTLPATIPIPVGQTVPLLTTFQYTAGTKVTIKVTTTDGTFMTLTGTGANNANQAAVNLNSQSGPVNTAVTVTGSGFTAGATVTIKFDTTTVTTATATAAGALPTGVTFNIPATATTGIHTVTATDGTHSPTTTFTVSTSGTVATKLAFSSGGAQSLTVNVVSGAIVVERQDASNNPVATGTSQITVALTSSGAGTFYSDAAGANAITQIVIAAGASDSAGFYYKATAVGTGTHTLTGASAGLTSATSAFTISAANPVATKLAFSSGGAQSLTVNVVSGAIVVERQDASNNPVATGTSQITVALTSSGAGTFYSDAAGANAITQIVIAAGASDSAGFYYKATAVGTGTHTLTGASAGLTSATSAFTISAANPVATKLAFSSGGAQSLTVNVVSGAIVVERQDASNNPVATGTSQITVALTSSGAGTFYSDAAGANAITQIVIAAGASDSAGFYYKATAVGTGTHTLTGASAGLTSATSAFTISAAAAPTLDVSSTGTYATGNTYTISLTPANANDILYVSVTTANYGTATISGGGLTWNSRATAAISSSRTLQTFWASKTTSGQITITINCGGQTSSAVAFAVSGVGNVASPFDTTNAVTNTGSSGTASAAITTTHANDFIIGAVGVRNNPTLTIGSGFTSVGSVVSSDPGVGAEYQRVTTTQSNLSVGYTFASNNWAIVVDAIKGP